MDILKFHTNQTDLAKTIKLVVDSYLDNKISSDEMIKNVSELIKLNPDKYYHNEALEVTPKVKAILGVKRLSLINNALNAEKRVKE